MARDEFTAGNKRVIVARANNRCVVPGCTNPTSGPGAKSNEVANLGMVSHIYSAAADGPRGRGGLSADQIKHPDNGVLCCRQHGTLVDTNQGGAYPAALLQGWKRLQEASVKRAMDGQPTSVGWAHSIRVIRNDLFVSDTALQLSKVTVLHGKALGKTALLDWIGASVGRPLPERWRDFDNGILTELRFFAPDETKIELHVTNRKPWLSIAGARLAEPPPGLKVVMVPEDFWRLLAEEKDDDVGFGKVLRVDRDVIRGLETDLHRHGSDWGRHLAFKEETAEPADEPEEASDEGGETVVLRRHGITYAGMSGSEKTRALLEFACALARERSRTGGTLLALDASAWNFDDGTWDFYCDYLIRQPFQTIITRWDRWTPANLELWQSATRYRLIPIGSQAEIVLDAW